MVKSAISKGEEFVVLPRRKKQCSPFTTGDDENAALFTKRSSKPYPVREENSTRWTLFAKIITENAVIDLLTGPAPARPGRPG